MGSGAGGIYENTYGCESDAIRAIGHPDGDSLDIAYGKPVGNQEERPRRAAHPDNAISRFDIEENVRAMPEGYRITEAGHFGERGMKRGNRVYECKNPGAESRAFYEALGRGANDRPVKGVDALQRELRDGTLITYRQRTSVPDSPAVQISKSASGRVRNQKIHFVRSDQ